MRESKIKYLKFEYCNYEGTVYDFKINGYKIQEKVGSIMKQNDSFGFNLNKMAEERMEMQSYTTLVKRQRLLLAKL